MPLNQPYEILGYHSCDKKLALDILTGTQKLNPSKNSWDWLGEGIYFWEHNPTRSLEYGEENVRDIQFNKKKIEIPFVLGAMIELKKCLNLMDSESLALLRKTYADIYPGTTITTRNHIQVCVINPACIKGYFIPQPAEKFNPYLSTAFRA